MSLFQPAALANCSTQAIGQPVVPGSNVTFFDAKPGLTTYQFVPGGLLPNHPTINVFNQRFCNVTLLYTTEGIRGQTKVQVCLPEKWNGRFQATGGSGWSAGVGEFGEAAMNGALYTGYATAGTDSAWPTALAKDFAFKSPGVVDIKGLEWWAYYSLKDVSIIGKSVIQSYFGKAPEYSYWNGCSQGGRQGMALAQRYPKLFDGIAASAPPVQFGPLIIAGFWSQTVMHELGVYVNPCELNTITAAAIKACDGLDGVIDGLITDPDKCKFDPYTMIGKNGTCIDEGTVTVSKEAAEVAHAGWYGLKKYSNQTWMYDGATHEAPFVTSGVTSLGFLLPTLNVSLGLADRKKAPDGTWTGKPNGMVEDWITYFIKKNATFDTSTILGKDFDEIMETSRREYTPHVGTQSYDLSEFRDAGGKLMMYHGLVSFLRESGARTDKVIGRSNDSVEELSVLL